MSQQTAPLLLDAVTEIVQDQQRAFGLGDVEAFMGWFDLDLVSAYYTRRWFTGYAVKVASPQSCAVDVRDLQQIDEHNAACQVVFALTYKVHASEQASFHYHLLQRDDGSWLITEAEVQMLHEHWPDVPKRPPILLAPVPWRKQQRTGVQRTPAWWEDNELASLARATSEPLKASLYARALSRSTRYRSTHPEIDSAALAASMMSLQSCRLAFVLDSGGPAISLQSIQHYARLLMTGKEYKELRQANRSYFPARELSLQPLLSQDEIFRLQSLNPTLPLDVSCPEITAFYVVMLRLHGFSAWDSLVLIQPFHYLSLVELTRSAYIISGHDAIPMSPTRLYSDTEVTRVTSAAYYLDQSGLTNMSEEEELRIVQRLQQRLPLFSFPRGKERFPLPEESEPTASVHTTRSPEALHDALLRHTFRMSQRYPTSPFTWARYAYQTLLVAQPQAYLHWSLKAPECKRFIQKYPSFSLALQWMHANLDTCSLFEEPDRIMTADQVLRCRCGAAPDRALFIYTLARLFDCTDTGGVVLTTGGSYAVLGPDKIYDAQTLQTTPSITGRLILAFDDSASYDPRHPQAHLQRKELAWLDALAHEGERV